MLKEVPQLSVGSKTLSKRTGWQRVGGAGHLPKRASVKFRREAHTLSVLVLQARHETTTRLPKKIEAMLDQFKPRSPSHSQWPMDRSR